MRVVRTITLALTLAAAVSATPALAGSSFTASLSGNSDPSVAGEPVTLTASVTGAAIETECSAAIQDIENVAQVCSGPITFTTDGFGNGSGTCTHTFATSGNRTVSATLTGCANTTINYVQNVTAAPVAAVPTLSEWAMWGLTGCLLLAGAAAIARRSRRFDS